jgi:hypothetical protein
MGAAARLWTASPWPVQIDRFENNPRAAKAFSLLSKSPAFIAL